MTVRRPLVLVSGAVKELPSGDTLPGSNPTVTSSSASTYTLADTDAGTVIEFTAAVTVTVPSTLSAGFNVTMIQSGSGQITVSAGSGSTIVSHGSYTKSAAAGAVVGLVRSATAGTYYFYGDRA